MLPHRSTTIHQCPRIIVVYQSGCRFVRARFESRASQRAVSYNHYVILNHKILHPQPERTRVLYLYYCDFNGRLGNKNMFYSKISSDVWLAGQRKWRTFLWYSLLENSVRSDVVFQIRISIDFKYHTHADQIFAFFKLLWIS